MLFGYCRDTAWSNESAYDIRWINVGGSGNIVPYFQQAYSTGDFDAIFSMVDVDCHRTSCFDDVLNGLEDFLGYVPTEAVLFANPCIIQLMIKGFNGQELHSSSKKANNSIVHDNWPMLGNKPYGAHQWQLDIIRFSFLENGHFEKMIRGLSSMSDNHLECPSSSVPRFIRGIGGKSTKWVNDSMKRRIARRNDN